MTTPFAPFEDLLQISDPFGGILLDAYGVFWAGGESGLLPGSSQAMSQLISSGKIVGILSNSTQLSAKEISKLSAHGLVQGMHFHFLLTSGEVARSIFLHETLPFATPRSTFWLFGGPHPRFSSHEAIFKETRYREVADLDEADFIYVSIPHIDGKDERDPESFREGLEKIMSKKLPMICPNPDRFAHEGKPPQAVVRQGSIAKMYEEMGGTVFYIGKPHQKVYSVAFNEFQKRGLSNPRAILMVGDTPETDIRGARQFGMLSALVTETGIMADRIAHDGLEKAITELPLADTPDYLIKRFANDFCSTPQS